MSLVLGLNVWKNKAKRYVNKHVLRLGGIDGYATMEGENLDFSGVSHVTIMTKVKIRSSTHKQIFTGLLPDSTPFDYVLKRYNNLMVGDSRWLDSQSNLISRTTEDIDLNQFYTLEINSVYPVVSSGDLSLLLNGVNQLSEGESTYNGLSYFSIGDSLYSTYRFVEADFSSLIIYFGNITPNQRSAYNEDKLDPRTYLDKSKLAYYFPFEKSFTESGQVLTPNLGYKNKRIILHGGATIEKAV